MRCWKDFGDDPGDVAEIAGQDGHVLAAVVRRDGGLSGRDMERREDTARPWPPQFRDLLGISRNPLHAAFSLDRRYAGCPWGGALGEVTERPARSQRQVSRGKLAGRTRGVP